RPSDEDVRPEARENEDREAGDVLAGPGQDRQLIAELRFRESRLDRGTQAPGGLGGGGVLTRGSQGRGGAPPSPPPRRWRPSARCPRSARCRPPRPPAWWRRLRRPR